MITSEKVGDYSRNFSNISVTELQKEVDSTDKKIDKELQSMLLFTGLLYSGVAGVR